MKAETRYTELFNELQNRLRQLKEKVDQHKRNFEKNPNWSYVGDIQHVNEQMKIITDFVR